MSSYHINHITISTFNKVLSRYPATVPDKLRDLDTQRFETIPNALTSRRDDSKDKIDGYLSKKEVETLVEWKLKHGTFRPKLLQLVQGNDEETIEETTRAAFAHLDPGDNDTSGCLTALQKHLVKLKGIGPATASLLLSVASPASVPFFSDEMFRWCTWHDKYGWKQPIKYNQKEYAEVLTGVGELRARLGLRAVDVEKVAWVLGKEGVDCGENSDAEEAGKEETIKESQDNEGVQEPSGKGPLKKGLTNRKAEKEISEMKSEKRGTKRKAGEVKEPAQGTRKSTRTRN